MDARNLPILNCGPFRMFVRFARLLRRCLFQLLQGSVSSSTILHHWKNATDSIRVNASTRRTEGIVPSYPWIFDPPIWMKIAYLGQILGEPLHPPREQDRAKDICFHN